ncbi:ABC transporter permease [Halolactibacillus sp. JCM 19043]|nr:ABC transporter permease [Halolactibacillus sp. JCM 19043]
MAFEIPAVPASEAFGLSLSELSMFGVLITILLTASSISQERQTGVSELLLVKPINASHYIGSKALAKMVVFTGALIISLLFSWYYVSILFGSLSVIYMMLAIIFYSCWFIFVISLTLTYAAVIRQQYMIVGATILTLAAGSIINGIFHHKIPWFYNNLSSLIVKMLQTGAVSTNLLLNIGLLLATSIALLLLSFKLFDQKERL